MYLLQSGLSSGVRLLENGEDLLEVRGRRDVWNASAPRPFKGEAAGKERLVPGCAFGRLRSDLRAGGRENGADVALLVEELDAEEGLPLLQVAMRARHASKSV